MEGCSNSVCPLGIRNITFQLIESSVDLADRGLSPLTSPIPVHKRTSVEGRE